MEDQRRKITHSARRIVVKIGSSVLIGEGQGDATGKGISSEVLSGFAADIMLAVNSGKECVLVSSGALAMGMKELSIKMRPTF